MRNRLLSLLLVFSLIFTAGCGGQESAESGENADSVSKVETEETTEAETGFQEEAWEVYQTALTATTALTSRQEESVVITTQSTRSSETEETIRLVITQLGLDTDSQELSAVGTVTSDGTSVALQVYYVGGRLYTLTGSVKEQTASTFEAALTAVDFLGSFTAELAEEYFSNCVMTEYADGTIILDLDFEGEISGNETTGSGEVIVDEAGIIISQKYDLETSYKSGGQKVTVSQAVEVTMLAYGDLVSSIEYPDFSDYQEIASETEEEAESETESESDSAAETDSVSESESETETESAAEAEAGAE